MKKSLFICLLFLSCIGGFAQSKIFQPSDSLYEKPRRVYCELLGMSNFFNTKVKISVDFGQSRSLTSDERLVDENGKVIKFNSMVDGMNYMGQFGWKFAQAYVVTIGQQNVYHWLLYKDIMCEADTYKGFQTKHQFKDAATLDLTLISCTLQYLKKRKKDNEWELVYDEYRKNLPKTDLENIIAEWKQQSDDNYDYEVKVTRDK